MAEAGSLSICGFGLAPEQITLETIEVLADAEIVFTDALDEPSWRPLVRYCAELRDLNASAAGLTGIASTRRKAAVVFAAIAEGKRCAVLNFGHAVFLSSLSEELLAGCAERGTRVRIWNSVSSLGAVFSEIGFSGLWKGFRLYDADNYRGLIQEARFDPSLAAVIVKIGYLLKSEQKDKLPRLLDKLAASYPASQRAYLVECPWLGNPNGAIAECALGEIGSALKHPNEFVTLFIPPDGQVLGRRTPGARGGERLLLSGFGLKLKQMTLETISALRDADVVFSDALDDARSLSKVRALCREFRDLNRLSGGARGFGAAERKTQIVLGEIQTGRRALVLNYGHPTFLSSLAEDLIVACGERGISWRALNSVASIDGVFSSLGYSGLWNGLEVYDADDFRGSVRSFSPRPSVPALLVKIGYLAQNEQAGALGALSNRLTALYPSGHRAVIVESPWQGNPSGRKKNIRLSDLELEAGEASAYVSLYIPPTEEALDGGESSESSAESAVMSATAAIKRGEYARAESAIEAAFSFGDDVATAQRLAELNEPLLDKFGEKLAGQLRNSLEGGAVGWWRPYLLGVWSLRRENFEEAKRLLRLSLELHPNGVLARNALARITTVLPVSQLSHISEKLARMGAVKIRPIHALCSVEAAARAGISALNEGAAGPEVVLVLRPWELDEEVDRVLQSRIRREESLLAREALRGKLGKAGIAFAYAAAFRVETILNGAGAAAVKARAALRIEIDLHGAGGRIKTYQEELSELSEGKSAGRYRAAKQVLDSFANQRIDLEGIGLEIERRP